ncbi:hypothetical protein T484DRAFT_1888493, partial [Baffinella frigidus]
EKENQEGGGGGGGGGSEDSASLGGQDAAEQDEGAGLFITLSRVNHACCPSAARVQYSSRGRGEGGGGGGGLRLVARRVIEEGEEITQSYLSEADLALPQVRPGGGRARADQHALTRGR